MPGANRPGPVETFTIERLISMMDEGGVDRAVIAPPSLTAPRNDYGLEAAKRHPDRFKVMGRFPMEDPKAVELLPRVHRIDDRSRVGQYAFTATLRSSQGVFRK